MGHWAGSNADLARLELACEVERQFGVEFSDDSGAVGGWVTVGDVAGSVLALRPEESAAALTRVRELIAHGFGVPAEQVTADAEMFGDPLQLGERGQMRWADPPAEKDSKPKGRKG